MKIKSISIDQVNFYNIEGELDLDNKTLELEIDFSKYVEIFKLDSLYARFNLEKINKYNAIYVKDLDNIEYSCFNCRFGMKLKTTVKLYTFSIDCILKNKISDTENILANKVIIKTTYSNNCDIDLYIKDFTINYTANKKIYIKTNKGEKNNIFIEVESLRECKLKNLSNIAYSIIEMIFLIYGYIPLIERIIVYLGKNEMELYIENADKYKQSENIRTSLEVLASITNKEINKDTIKKFMRFRKESKILFDMFLVNKNSNGYLEIKNSMLIQLLEGLYKTVGPNKKTTLYNILKYYFVDNASTNIILSDRDKKIINKDYCVFLIKAKNHRNYLSHLDVKKHRSVFIKLENVYAYWKLSICVRLYIMQYVGIEYNKENLDKDLKLIEDWAKEHRIVLRYN